MSNLSFFERRLLDAIGIRTVTISDICLLIPFIDKGRIARTVWKLLNAGFLKINQEGKIERVW